MEDHGEHLYIYAHQQWLPIHDYASHTNYKLMNMFESKTTQKPVQGWIMSLTCEGQFCFCLWCNNHQVVQIGAVEDKTVKNIGQRCE